MSYMFIVYMTLALPSLNKDFIIIIKHHNHTVMTVVWRGWKLQGSKCFD